MCGLRHLAIIGMLLFATFLEARGVTVEALFTNQAMVKIDGKRILLRAGEEKQGMTLISTDTYRQTAVLEIDGNQDSYELGRHIGGGYAEPDKTEVMITANNRGSFFTNGHINGRPVRFLLDTGASHVAFNEVQARSLGLDYMDEKNRVAVATAGGKQNGYRVVLKNVSIGGISLSNVQGVVHEGDNPPVNLLGMSFLSQLEIEQKRNLMILRKKF